MRITIEIDTKSLDERDAAILALLSNSAGDEDRSTPFAASAAEAASDTSAGATPATPTTSRRSRRGVSAAASTEPAASTPASATSPGDVFANPSASAPAAPTSPLTGDVFSQQVKAANLEAAAGSVTKASVGQRVSELLPTLGAKGLKEVLGKYHKPDGEPVTVLRDLQEKDFGAFLDDLSVYG